MLPFEGGESVQWTPPPPQGVYLPTPPLYHSRYRACGAPERRFLDPDPTPDPNPDKTAALQPKVKIRF